MTANTKLQKTIEKYNVKKAQIESLAREMETLANSRASLDVSKEALETLDGAKKGKEMLVPLGVNIFLKAVIEDPSKVVKGIGAGLFKNIKTKIEADFKKTAAEMETLEPELEKMMADKRAKD
jgi:prefoldin alpha subunit